MIKKIQNILTRFVQNRMLKQASKQASKQWNITRKEVEHILMF